MPALFRPFEVEHLAGEGLLREMLIEQIEDSSNENEFDIFLPNEMFQINLDEVHQLGKVINLKVEQILQVRLGHGRVSQVPELE